MAPFIRDNKIKTGDVIIVPKNKLNITRHYAVYTGLDPFGNENICENKSSFGVRAITLQPFLHENPALKRIRRFHGNETQREEAIHRANSLLGKGYSLAGFNCEHFANYVQFGYFKSRQVESVFRFAAAVIF